jgi:Holliday junction resolvase RusA-like endonuclease
LSIFDTHAAVVFEFAGKCKSGKNAVQITRQGRRYPNESFVKWRHHYGAQLGRQWGLKPPITEELKAVIRYTPGDRIRRDAPGIIDALFHLFEHFNIVADDAQFKAIDYAQQALNKTAPNVSVRIEPLKRL